MRWKRPANGPIFLRMSSTRKLHKIDYGKLNGRQRENYNFQKISGLLADYGFTTIRLSDDWNGADFLAQHVDGKTVLRIQLKGRLGIYKNYQQKKLWICFRDGFGESATWYLYPHDKVAGYLLKTTNIQRTAAWRKRGGYNWNHPPRYTANYLKQFVMK
jgi:hypothetical protein